MQQNIITCISLKVIKRRVEFPPATADEVLIIVILFSVDPANVGERGHKAVLSSGADEHASILAVRIKL